MIHSILLSIFVFVCMVFIHSGLHRILLHWKKITLWTSVVYAVGFVWLYGVNVWRGPSIALYSLLWINMMQWYLFLMHGGVIPSAVILASFTRYHMQSYRQLRARFHEKELITDRLDDLIRAGLVRRIPCGYCVTNKGRWIMKGITVYCRLFHVQIGG